MVAITVMVATIVGSYATGTAEDLDNTKKPPVSGVAFDFDYQPSKENVEVRVKTPGNVDALYIDKRDGEFNGTDISKTRGWNSSLTKDGRVLNEDPGAADKVIIGNVSSEDSFAVTAEDSGGKEYLIDYWELEP